MDIKDIKPKYRTGDIFTMIGAIGHSWWQVKEIVYGATEPIYVLKMMPFGKAVIEIGESELCENWYSSTINNLEQ